MYPSDPTPPDAQQRPRQGQGRRCRGNGVAGVAQVAAAAAVGEAGDRREHLGETRVIAVCVSDTLTDGLPTWREETLRWYEAFSKPNHTLTHHN